MLLECFFIQFEQNGTSGIVFQTSLDLARMRSPKFRRIISDSGLS
jgi:hypothetical protein